MQTTTKHIDAWIANATEPGDSGHRIYFADPGELRNGWQARHVQIEVPDDWTVAQDGSGDMAVHRPGDRLSLLPILEQGEASVAFFHRNSDDPGKPGASAYAAAVIE